MNDEDDEPKKKSSVIKKLQKEALKDIIPNKGTPDNLRDEEPSVNDATKKVGKSKDKKKSEEARKKSRE